MKKYVFFLLAGLAAIAFSCTQITELTPEEQIPSGPVTLIADIANENGTKASLDDGSGIFAFSASDVIKVHNGTKAYNGTTTAGGATASFTMEDGFEDTGAGLAAFPAGIVNAITASNVTFILPTNYTYAEVGDSDPDAAKVPCPMVASYVAGSKLNFKQAGAVVRIRVTNIAAGTLSFTFPTNVTGKVTIDAVPSGNDDGILASNLTQAGHTITVLGVPAIASGSYAYITLPVPTGTKPENILVVNTPSDASNSRLAAIAGSSTELNRAGGRKLSVSPEEAATPTFKVDASTTVVIAPGNLMAHVASYPNPKDNNLIATADRWRFGSFFEFIGDAINGGNYLFEHKTGFTDKWIDIFTWQGISSTSKAHGLVNVTSHNDTYHGNGNSESLYEGCWETDASNGSTGGYIQIENGGSYKWRPLTNDEWNYLLNNTSRYALIDGTKSRFARATVAGVNGLLIFPESSSNIWDTTTMGSAPTGINSTGSQPWGTNSYSAANFVAMYNVGIVFLPAAGYGYRVTQDVGVAARYASSTGYSTKNVRAPYFYNGGVTISYSQRYMGFSVRLARELSN